MNTRRRWLLVFALIGCLLAEGLWRSGALNSIDQRLHDYWFQWQGKRTEASHVVMVSIDDASLAAFPDDPLVFWTDRMALAISRLRQAQASAVGLDMLLSISPERWLGKLGGEWQKAARDYDQPFREQINSGQLVLVATRTGSGQSANDYLMPSPDYLLALPDFDISGYIGLADFVDEEDGVVRQFKITPPVASQQASTIEGVPVLGFPSLLAIRAAGLDPRAASWSLGGRTVLRDQLPTSIPFVGPPDSIVNISFKDLLQPEGLSAATAELVRAKVVLIGAGAGLGDDHFTPYTSSPFFKRGRLMSGTEVHAHVVESLLSGYQLQTLDAKARVFVLALVSITSALVFAALSAWVGVMVWFAGVLSLSVVGYAAFQLGILLPVPAFAAASALVSLGVIAWRLSGEERERARLRQMFGRYVSNQVVDALLASGNRPELGGTSQTMTVLFADIRNFTTFSELLSAREVVELLNTYFERACAVMLAQGGSIDKFIGDAIMVEFGSPLPLADHALRGVRAGLALRAVVDDFSDWVVKRFPGRNLPAFAVGIGLHSGEAVIGNIGSATRMEFTAIGDTVNLASRVEGLTKVMGCAILATEATVLAAGDVLVCGRSEVMPVKGRAATVKVFEVLGITTGEK